MNAIIKYIDGILNRLTMYRVVLYYLLGLLGLSIIFGEIGWISINPLYLVAEAGFILAVCWIVNEIFSRAFKAPTNVESVYITALILTLLISPGRPFEMMGMYLWSAVIAMSAKYIFAYKKQHVFNPVAIAAVVMSLAVNQVFDWWVAGNLFLLPFVFLGGLLIVRKIKRGELVWSFFGGFAIITLADIFINGGNILTLLTQILPHSPIFFLAFVMLTEPLTAPTKNWSRIVYGFLVGALAVPSLHMFGFSSTPELALVLGNIFAFSVTAKDRAVLALLHKKELAVNTFEFAFKPDTMPMFIPGQYMEWTLPHEKSDSRGNRRYFTIASSPTEKDFLLGIKTYQKGSTYKEALLAMESGASMAVAQATGDFVLPEDKTEKLAFVAGGIGITPFRSMIKYLSDKNEKRDIVLFYLNKTADEIAYADVFKEAHERIGLKVVYVLTDAISPVGQLSVELGPCDAKMIARNAPDYKSRTFYISGPHGMVDAFDHNLKEMGVPSKQVKVDFFPGFA